MLVEVATMLERPGGNTHGNGKCVRQDSWARKWQPRVYDRQLGTTYKRVSCLSETHSVTSMRVTLSETNCYFHERIPLSETHVS
jgi:hypothetical protein